MAPRIIATSIQAWSFSGMDMHISQEELPSFPRKRQSEG
jgi:hypothetical protein